MAVSHINGVPVGDLSAVNGILSISEVNGLSTTLGDGGGLSGTSLKVYSVPDYIYAVDIGENLSTAVVNGVSTITITTNTDGWVAGTYTIENVIAGFTTPDGDRNLYYKAGGWGGSAEGSSAGVFTVNP